MQSIIHSKEYKHVHPIFSEIERFFTFTSELKAKPSMLPYVWDKSFSCLYDIFTNYGGFEGDCEFINKHYKKLELPEFDPKNIILCFSGGKDSVAAIKYYKEHGYNVYLFHVPKINPSQNREETEQSVEIAKYLGLPIYIEEIKISGKHEWVEHPMKNMIIATCALEWGIKNNITTKVAFGNYQTSYIDDDSFEFCSGDDVEMWGAYEIIVSKVIPNFEINLCLKNILTSMEAVCPDKELLNLTVSCLGRSSLRKRNHDWILSKFGVNLPTHRCGQCYKCCHEYLYMVEHGLQEFNDRYYNYCLKRLKANLDKERYVDDTSVEEICERFFVDPKSEYLKRALKVGKI